MLTDQLKEEKDRKNISLLSFRGKKVDVTVLEGNA